MKYWKQFWVMDTYGVAACIIIIGAVALRLLLLALGWPPLDSDEGTMGLMAMHIAFKGEWPIFFYGQGYMGTFEAYIAALFFQLFGVSTFTLLLGLVLMYGGFLIAIYRLTALLYTRGLALVVLILLSLGSNAMFSRELVAIGGYPETLLFGAIVMVLGSWLALTSGQDKASLSQRERRKRMAGYAGWGFVAGLGIWTHLLTLPFIFLSGLLILLFCWWELRRWTLVVVIGTLLIGAMPMIIYNVIAVISSPGQDTLSYFLRVHSASGVVIPDGPPLILRQLWGAFLVSLPTMTGATPICAVSRINFLSLGDPNIASCTAWHTGWSVGVCLLWLWAALIAFCALWRYRRASLEERPQLILQVSRLALLGSGALTLLLYVVSPDSGLFPNATSRYLVGLLISLPAVIWPLWRGTNLVAQKAVELSKTKGAHLNRTARQGILLFVGMIYLLGTFSIFSGFPAPPPVDQRFGTFATQVNDQHLNVAATQAINKRQYALINDLLRIGAVHIYSDYWTCNRLMFQSQERVICAALDVVTVKKKPRFLRIGQNRYYPYLRVVRSDEHAAVVFEAGSPEARIFSSLIKLFNVQGDYQYHEFDGYVVFQPLPKHGNNLVWLSDS